MQKLIIKNFGPIKDVDLDLNDFMVFIGPQASGKSTISKTLYFFRLIRTEFAAFFDEKFVQKEISQYDNLDGEELKARISTLFFRIFELSNYYSNSSYLSFEYQDGVSIVLTVGKGANAQPIEASFSDGFSSRYIELVTRATNILKQGKTSINEVAAKDIQALQIREARNLIIISAYELFQDNRLLSFIPAGRSYYAIAPGRINISNNNGIDFLVKQFADEIDYLRKQLFSSYSTDEFLFLGNTVNISPIIKAAQSLLSQILKGSYSSKDGLDSIVTKDGVNILLQYASSGQQESVWILLVIIERVYYAMQSQLFIEEPEAHLFPESQKLIVDLIALFANHTDNKVVITTHSPYILAAINNLLYAQIIGQKNKEAVGQIIDPLLWLNYKRLGVYFVENGTIRNILDSELKAIRNEEIDIPASSIINAEFDKISEIEFQK
jgi:ABC-type lipoprotein export system ATPase subunit